ncbi:MAG: hypothetical protein GXP16_15040 [Gammaproteobacteria bacterium]|nr:hypothetical protein [Gammaproteobacteria bacterium]
MAVIPRDKPTNREIKASLLLADRVVEKQGALFIREFLRKAASKDKEIRIGATKRDVVQNLNNAINQGRIQLDALRQWVLEVEGWGKQHVYLYHVSEQLTKALWLKSEKALEIKLVKACLKKYLNKRDELNFSEQLELGHIGLNNDGFQCVWRQGTTHRKRDDTKDERRKIDGDSYEFDAFRIQPMRAVMRFELRPKERIAALFLQRPMTQHEEAKVKVKAILFKLFNQTELTEANIGNAIRILDQQDMDNTNSLYKSKQVKFHRQGASIEFIASPGLGGWKDVQKVRDVRKALDPNAFSGENAHFKVQLTGTGGMQREVVMALSARDHRMYFFAQMKADEIWTTLKTISAHTK